MTHRLFLMSVLFVLMVRASGALAADAVPPLNTVLGARDELARPPSNFFWLRNNLQAALDPVNGDMVFLNDSGATLGRARMPAGMRVSQVIPQAAVVELWDSGSGRSVTVSRDVNPSQIRQIAEAGRDRRNLSAARIERLDRSRAILLSSGSSGNNPITALALDGGMLTDVYPIGQDAEGNRFFGVEELLSPSPAITTHVSVQRFTRDGLLNGYIKVPLDGMDAVPRGFLTVTGSGNVRIMSPSRTGVDIIEQPVISISPFDVRASTKMPSLGRERPPPSTVTKLKVHIVPVDGQGDLSQGGGGRTKKRNFVPTPITRTQILSNANSYLHVNWVARQENLFPTKLISECNKSHYNYWQRPNYLDKSSVGKTFSEMPYKWGGDDTPSEFLKKIAAGSPAGNVCTCRDKEHQECWVAEAAGIDCSGFVSRSWGIPKRGTTQLLDVTVPVAGISAMKQGDAFLWAGHHVRLFVGTTQGAFPEYIVLESATRKECEGVCRSTYRLSELNKYQLRRFFGVSDGQ